MAAWITVQDVVIPSMLKALPAQQRSIFARLVRNMDTLQVYASQNRNLIPNIVHIKSQLRRWKIIVNPKWKKMVTPTVMTASHGIK